MIHVCMGLYGSAFWTMTLQSCDVVWGCSWLRCQQNSERVFCFAGIGRVWFSCATMHSRDGLCLRDCPAAHYLRKDWQAGCMLPMVQRANRLNMYGTGASRQVKLQPPIKKCCNNWTTNLAARSRMAHPAISQWHRLGACKLGCNGQWCQARARCSDLVLLHWEYICYCFRI